MIDRIGEQRVFAEVLHDCVGVPLRRRRLVDDRAHLGQQKGADGDLIRNTAEPGLEVADLLLLVDGDLRDVPKDEVPVSVLGIEDFAGADRVQGSVRETNIAASPELAAR